MNAADRAADDATGSLEAAVRLAHVLCRPLDHCADAMLPTLPLPPSELRALAAHPAFHGPVNRAVAEAQGIGRIGLDGDVLARLSDRPLGRLALLVVTEPAARVETAARLLAAAVLHKRLAGLVFKADRQRAREVLGEAGFTLATSEAAVMHARLAELDAVPAQRSDIAALESAEAVLRFGYALLERTVATVEPQLAAFFRIRFGSFAGEPVGTVTAAHGEQILKLLRRSVASWQARIG